MICQRSVLRLKRYVMMVLWMIETVAGGCAEQEAQVPFEILLNGADRLVWFQDTADPGALFVPLTGIEERQTETPFPPTELKQIDFDKEVGVYLTQGHKGFLEYWVEVERIERKEQQVTVRANVIEPKGAAADMSSYRVTLVKMKKSDLPQGNVKFVFYDQDGEVLAEQSVTL